MWTPIQKAPKGEHLTVKNRDGVVSVAVHENGKWYGFCNGVRAYGPFYLIVCDPTHFFDFEANETMLRESADLIESLSEMVELCRVSNNDFNVLIEKTLGEAKIYIEKIEEVLG